MEAPRCPPPGLGCVVSQRYPETLISGHVQTPLLGRGPRPAFAFALSSLDPPSLVRFPCLFPSPARPDGYFRVPGPPGMGAGIPTSSGPDCRRRSSRTTATLATPPGLPGSCPWLKTGCSGRSEVPADVAWGGVFDFCLCGQSSVQWSPRRRISGTPFPFPTRFHGFLGRWR